MSMINNGNILHYIFILLYLFFTHVMPVYTYVSTVTFCFYYCIIHYYNSSLCVYADMYVYYIFIYFFLIFFKFLWWHLVIF